MINIKLFFAVCIIAVTSIVINAVFFFQNKGFSGENKELRDWKKDAQHQLDSMAGAVIAYKDTVTNDREAAQSIIVPDKPTHEAFTPVHRDLPPDSTSKLFSRAYGDTSR